MKKEGSTASMLWLDICRGFCSKRFWGIVGVVTIVFVVFLTLDIIYPLQKYYNGYGTFDWEIGLNFDGSICCSYRYFINGSVCHFFSIYWSNSICWNDNR